jgi:hypothetical protein
MDIFSNMDNVLTSCSTILSYANNFYEISKYRVENIYINESTD